MAEEEVNRPGEVMEGVRNETKPVKNESNVGLGLGIPPRMVLRVLLVEADDSTRRIIAALLRKCNYRVAAVSDGLKAWETLKGRPHNVDLILTEVELPSISGYALLTLIMEHDTCKNIPVIMMSSKDSISTVLKCMLKGAADFLIKPVRKNELRNLWQHVWRRQIRNASCNSEDVVDTQQKVEMSENNASSNDSSDILISNPGNSKHSGEGSDLQDLPEVKSRDASKLLNDEKCSEMAEESNLAQSEHREVFSCLEADNTVAMRVEEDYSGAKFIAKHTETQSEICSKNDHNHAQLHCGTHDLAGSPTEVIDLIGKFNENPDDTGQKFDADEKTEVFSIAPRLELTLRSLNPHLTNDEETQEQHRPNHLKASAFSKYDNNNLMRPPVFPLASSCTISKLSGNASPMRHDAVSTNSQENMKSLVITQPGQPQELFQGPGFGFIPAPGVRLDYEFGGYYNMYSPILHTQSGFAPLWSLRSHPEQSPVTSSSIRSTSEVITEQGLPQLKESAAQSAEQTLQENDKNVMTAEAVAHNSPAIGSTSWSSGAATKFGCTGSQSTSSKMEDCVTHAAVSARTSASESVNDNHNLVHDGVRGFDSNFSSHREAALMKFRLKRKDRCFEKKVRYQSRKRLAEQRPRVKGQFVRQVQTETPSADVGSARLE